MRRSPCMRLMGLLLPVLLLAPLRLSPAQVAVAQTCPAPLRRAGPARLLPGTARALLERQPVRVAALGSALQGPHETPAESLPARMLERLRHVAPGAQIDLRLRNQPGATAAEMLSTLRHELRAGPAPTLLLWQTGTVDVARKIAPETFGAVLAQGVRLAHDAGTDLVLIDPLYSRLLQDRADVTPYEAQFEKAASAPGADLFRRHALTRQWVDSGAIDIEAAPRGERARTLAALHDCLAAALARQIIGDATAGQQNAAQN